MIAPLLWVLLAACAVAVVTDVTRRRIPNWLTISLVFVSLAFHASRSASEFGGALIACTTVFAIGFLAFSCGLLGGGDVKMLAAGAAAVGYADALDLILYTAAAGGILGLAFAAIQGRFAATVRGTRAMIATSSYRVSAVAVPARGATMPYAIAIASGAGLLALAKTVAPALRLPL